MKNKEGIMREENMSIEDKIVISTIECIEELGMQKATIRAIANKANVNVASINYYFRSKDELIKIALNKALENAFDEEFFEELDLKHSDRLVIVNNMFSFLMEGTFKFPNISKAYFYIDYIGSKNNNTSLNKLNSFLKIMAQKLLQLYPEKDINDIEISISQCMSLVLFSGLFPRTFNELNSLDLTQERDRETYVSYFINKYYN